MKCFQIMAVNSSIVAALGLAADHSITDNAQFWMVQNVILRTPTEVLASIRNGSPYAMERFRGKSWDLRSDSRVIQLCFKMYMPLNCCYSMRPRYSAFIKETVIRLDTPHFHVFHCPLLSCVKQNSIKIFVYVQPQIAKALWVRGST
jgi:hypothetical protein